MRKQTAFIGDRSSGRNNHFNLIRMIAASGVLVSHAYPISLGPGTAEPLQHWLRGNSLGGVSVCVFFAISGFFITKSFDRNPNYRRFLLARVLRIYPALITVLVLTVLISGMFLTTAPGATFWAAGPDYLLQNLSLIRLRLNLPGVFQTNPYGPTINGSLWALFYEVVCYVGVFFAGLVGLLRARRILAIILASFVILLLLAPSLPFPARALARLNLAFSFSIGTAFYIWRDLVPLRLSLALGLSALAALAYVTPLFGIAFTLALSYWVFVIGLTEAPRLLAYNRLGDYSYGTYIYAFPVQQIVAATGITLPLANMALAFPPTLMMAVLSWHLIEKPALALVRRPEAREQHP